MKIDYSEQLGIFLRGFLMGMCDVIPGVSGGTIALITGIYYRLINAISSIEPRMLLSFITFDKQVILSDLKKIDFTFLITLACGIGIAFLLMSRVITYFLQELPQITYAFFFGLILASCIYLLSEIQEKKYKYDISFMFGFIIGFLLIGFKPLEVGHSPLIIFITGMAALCAMILPGTSGAYITLLFGQYEYMLTSLRDFVLVDIITFCLGGAVGLIIASRILKYLLARYYAIMMSALVGLLLGTSFFLYIEVENAGGFDLSALLAIFVGIAVIAIMTFLKQKIKKGTEMSE